MRILIVLLAMLVPLSGAAQAAKLTLACLDIGRMLEACRANAEAFSAETGHEVRVVSASAADRLALEQYQALFSVESPNLDVVQFPDSWVPAIADDLVTLGALPDPSPFIAAAADGGEIAGRRVGWPQHIAITVLFLRSDVLGEDPQLWSSLRERLVSAPADGATRLSLGGAGPALFSFFLDWLYGTGATALDDRAAIHKALSLLADFLGPVAAPGIAGMPSREATASFAGGDTAALIARSTQAPGVGKSDVADHVSETALPSVQDGPDDAAVLATTWYTGASRYTKEREAAEDLAAYLASEPVQRQNALKFGIAPARKDLYSDEDIVAIGPIFGQVAGLLDRLTGPPAKLYGAAYLDLADSVAETVRNVLRGDLDVDRATNMILRAVRRADRLRTN